MKKIRQLKSSKKDQRSSPSSSSSSSSYLADDENFKSFSAQLARIGLQLRDITGDGNCCFRALSDQMFGNESHHLEFRKRVCQYIRQNRVEFEPFVAALIDDSDDDDDGGGVVERKSSFLNSNKKLDAFEKYIKNLEQAGTYADNCCLVAFSRLYQLHIHIHQLNMPIWTINGLAENAKKPKQPVRELHLSYHNGEHYSSIRSLGDSSKTPTSINIQQDSALSSPKSVKTRKNNSSYFAEEFEQAAFSHDHNNLDLKIEQIIDVTSCMDINLIKDTLAISNYDTEQAIEMLVANLNIGKSKENDEAIGHSGKKCEKKDKKLEKKQRQMERQREKFLKKQKEKATKDGALSNNNSISYSTNMNNSQHDLSVSIQNIETKAI